MAFQVDGCKPVVFQSCIRLLLTKRREQKTPSSENYQNVVKTVYENSLCTFVSMIKSLSDVEKEMGILKTVELAHFAGKNAKRRRIMKTVALADFTEKNVKRMGILKHENLNVVVQPSELKPLQYNALLLCQCQGKRICKVFLFFRMLLKTFSFTKQRSLLSLSKVCQLQEQRVSEASNLYRFQKNPKEYVKNLSEVYRKQNDQKEWAL